MSDTESTTSQVDSFHSPLQSESPLRSEDTFLRPGNDDPGENNCRSIVLVDNYSSPLPSPGGSNFPASFSADGGNSRRPWPRSVKPNSENPDFPESPPGNYEPLTPENLDFPAKRAAAVVGVSKFVREEPSFEAKKVGPVGGGGGGRVLEEGYGGGGREEYVGGERRSRAAISKMALGFRVFEAIACLVSFSVMAADRTQGWSGDSFDRYIEYRYCVAVNVIGFVYSCFQAFDLAYHLATGKQVVAYHLRYHFDFTMDQASH
ncbi:CASP-like protein 4a3 [Phtheirospermum japonicum]|uniref:CASP-like protein n=1 Tax=Phtheirospermum japonicum TaxID=374723 RepID=A0A830B5R8_9LAMI|nr:CASP-like protein 4a3 [Phtheirospermum japonicum]